MNKITYNQNEDADRLAELNFVRAQSASSISEEDQRLSSILRNYAIIRRQSGNTDDALERMLESAKACEHSDFGEFVKEHSASIVRAVQEQNAAEQNKNSNFMKHYKLVNKIGSGIDIE